MADGRISADQANFRRALIGHQRCGGVNTASEVPGALKPCSMFLPHGTMLQGTCSAVSVETDDEHTCDLWEPRTEEDDKAADEAGYFDGDADDVQASLEARERNAGRFVDMNARQRILDAYHNMKMGRLEK